MVIFGIHIVGWILTLLFALSIILRRKLLSHILKEFSLSELKLFFQNLFVCIISTLILLCFYFSGKNLPFRESPRLYKELNNYIVTEKTEPTPELLNGISLCALGNIYRCRCELVKTAHKHPDKLKLFELQKIIDKGIKDQEKSTGYLK